jgi:hypothetical protein
LKTSLISKKKKTSESLEIISAYSNEITHIHICMKLDVNMCMKLERQKYSNFFLKDTKIRKDIEKNKEIYFSFNIL